MFVAYGSYSVSSAAVETSSSSLYPLLRPVIHLKAGATLHGYTSHNALPLYPVKGIRGVETKQEKEFTILHYVSSSYS